MYNFPRESKKWVWLELDFFGKIFQRTLATPFRINKYCYLYTPLHMTDFLTKKNMCIGRKRNSLLIRLIRNYFALTASYLEFMLFRRYINRLSLSDYSFLDSSLYPLAFLYKIIARKSSKPASHIESSFQLIQKLQGTVLDNK